MKGASLFIILILVTSIFTSFAFVTAEGSSTDSIETDYDISCEVDSDCKLEVPSKLSECLECDPYGCQSYDTGDEKVVAINKDWDPQCPTADPPESCTTCIGVISGDHVAKCVDNQCVKTSDEDSDELNNETVSDNDSDKTDRQNKETDLKTLRERAKKIKKTIDATQTRAERAKEVVAHLRYCEELDDRKERIACRLKVSDREDYDEDDYSRIPEVCKALNDRAECAKLYRAANHCYEIDDGRQKAKCFKRVSGFVKANINDEDDRDRPEKVRNYLVFLLYEIQERIEYKVDSGDLDEDTGADLIAQIVEIKEDLLNGEPRDVVKPKLDAFKTDFREAMAQ